MLKMIFAVGVNGEFGNSSNDLPWNHILQDMKHFNQYTMGSIVVMGRNTWESLPKTSQGVKLPGRICIVVTSDPDTLPFLANPVRSLAEARLLARTIDVTKDVIIIGGRALLESAAGIVQELSVTSISQEALKTTNWEVETYYLDALSIITKAENNGLTDWTSVQLGQYATASILSKGGI